MSPSGAKASRFVEQAPFGSGVSAPFFRVRLSLVVTAWQIKKKLENCKQLVIAEF